MEDEESGDEEAQGNEREAIEKQLFEGSDNVSNMCQYFYRCENSKAKAGVSNLNAGVCRRRKDHLSPLLNLAVSMPPKNQMRSTLKPTISLLTMMVAR